MLFEKNHKNFETCRITKQKEAEFDIKFTKQKILVSDLAIPRDQWWLSSSNVMLGRARFCGRSRDISSLNEAICL